MTRPLPTNHHDITRPPHGDTWRSTGIVRSNVPGGCATIVGMIISRRAIAGSCAGLAVAIAVATSVGSAEADAPAPPSRSVLQGKENAIVAAGVPGVSVEIRDQGGTWRGVAGVGDVLTKQRPDGAGEFRAGSITKSFVAAVALQLIAEKRIALDAPIDDYLPGLLPYKQAITVHELLQHRSGLVDYTKIQPNVLFPTLESVSTRRFRNYSMDALIRIATAKPLEFMPGSKFSYSNTNYLVLGELIEKITGQSVATELNRRVIAPLGLRHTYLAGAFPVLPRPAEHGYEQLAAGKPLTDLTTYNMTVAASAGAIVSTTDDLNRFYAALLTGRLLPPAQLQQMKQTVQTGPHDGYGLGLSSAQVCGETIWGHSGSAPGYHTVSFSTADASRQITISTNRSLTASPQAKIAINDLLAAEFCGSAPGKKAELRVPDLP